MNIVTVDIDKFLGEIDSKYSTVSYCRIKELLERAIIDTSTSSIPTINLVKDESLSIDYSIKSDKGKYRPTLCHQITIQAVSRVREHGASRYGGTDTWKRVEERRYKDALYRHWLAYLENPDGLDAESGLPILWHVACNVDFLLEMQRERMEKKEN